MSINHEFIVPKQPSSSNDDPLAKARIIMIIGSIGSGKSTLLANLLMALDENHDFANALFVTSNSRDKLLEAIEMPVTSSPVELNDFMLKIRQAKDGEKSLLVLDDIQGSPDFKIMLGRSEFIKFCLSHRHFGGTDKGGCWILATAQTMRSSYSPVFRDNVQLYFIYYPRSRIELKNLEDLTGDPEKMKKSLALLKLEGNHAFLFINKSDPSNVRYFLGFDREINFN